MIIDFIKCYNNPHSPTLKRSNPKKPYLCKNFSDIEGHPHTFP